MEDQNKQYDPQESEENASSTKKNIIIALVIVPIAIIIFANIIALCQHSHEWSNWRTVERASCNKNGLEIRRCIDPDCNEEETRVIEALGHDYKDATCTSPTKCKRCSATLGKALGHYYEYGKCTRCYDKLVNKLNINILPEELPVTVYAGGNQYLKITNLSWSVSFRKDNTFNIKIEYVCEKVFDYSEDNISSCGFTYTVTDSNGYILTVYRAYTSDLSVGQKTKGDFLILGYFDPEETYTITISDYSR